MHKIEIQTSQNVAIEYPTASLVERIFAFLIDYAIIIIYALTVFFTVDGFANYNQVQSISLLLILPVFIFYHFAFEVFNNGQSIGKMIFKLKVMQIDGSRPTLGNYFTRWLIGLIELYIFTGSPALLTIMFSSKSQRLGDIAANTIIVKTNKLKIGAHIVDQQFEADYTPLFYVPKMFNDQQAQLINAVLTNPDNLLRNKQILALSEKLKKTYNIFEDHDLKPKEFLAQLLKDYTFFYWEEENMGQIFDLKQDISKVLG